MIERGLVATYKGTNIILIPENEYSNENAKKDIIYVLKNEMKTEWIMIKNKFIIGVMKSNGEMKIFDNKNLTEDDLKKIGVASQLKGSIIKELVF